MNNLFFYSFLPIIQFDDVWISQIPSIYFERSMLLHFRILENQFTFHIPLSPSSLLVIARMAGFAVEGEAL